MPFQPAPGSSRAAMNGRYLKEKPRRRKKIEEEKKPRQENLTVLLMMNAALSESYGKSPTTGLPKCKEGRESTYQLIGHEAGHPKMPKGRP